MEMEESADEDVKCYDETAAFIHSSFSPTLPSGLSKGPCELDGKALFVKTQPTSPDRNTTDVHQNPGSKLECESNLNMLIKTEATSPAREQEEERSLNASGLAKEPCELDSKAWFVKTEPTSPHRGALDLGQDPGAASNQMSGSEWGTQSSYCPPTAQLNSDPQIHVDSEHKKLNDTQCPYCDYNTNFRSDLQLQSDLQIHIHTVHMKLNTRKYKVTSQCPHCEYKTNWKTTLKMHIDSVHNKITFQCPHCECKTNRKRSLNYHIDTVHNKITFQCPHCEYKANTKCSLKNHIHTVHEKIKEFQCAHCKYKCSLKNTMKNHIDSVHNNIWAFQCPHCQYKTNRKRTLKIHIDSVHKKIRPFQCPNCEYKTTTNSKLNRHIKALHERETVL